MIIEAEGGLMHCTGEPDGEPVSAYAENSITYIYALSNTIRLKWVLQ